MTIDIHCAGGCGTVLGSVELENEEDFKGDAYYQNYCDDCVKPNTEPVEEVIVEEVIVEETPIAETPIEEQPIIE
jgi:hypothetical protein